MSQDTARSNSHAGSSPSPSDQQESHQESHQVPATVMTQSELLNAFKDLQKGEGQAEALEAKLTRLEDKLDALLASFEDADSSETNGGADADTKVKREQTPEEKQK
ncbi:hypothetical protein F4808DRAFT_166080 [Astrocystis sublimbata]|nr:hypothetical protein F4808DRAFT_166080 [Astrocystis sublimbata]